MRRLRICIAQGTVRICFITEKRARKRWEVMRCISRDPRWKHPWYRSFVGTDITASTNRSGNSTLIGRQTRTTTTTWRRGVACVNCRTTNHQCICKGGAAVILQGRKLCVDWIGICTKNIASGWCEVTHCRLLSNKVISLAINSSTILATISIDAISRNNCVSKDYKTTIIIEAVYSRIVDAIRLIPTDGAVINSSCSRAYIKGTQNTAEIATHRAILNC